MKLGKLVGLTLKATAGLCCAGVGMVGFIFSDDHDGSVPLIAGATALAGAYLLSQAGQELAEAQRD